ncbi:MAG TPA: Rne/Rng family ribonuclease [Candidatus Acidoferrales bacterium]|nr:Rne/Rng family ribonuclease [Candidatus Acidoferrales bacterium]
MAKEMVVSANPHETRVAILEDGQLCEIYVEREKEFALVGSIYKGRVTRVLPGMQSSFVDIGLDSDAFLYVSDFLQEIEDMDHDSEDHGARAARPSNPPADDSVAPTPVTALPGETIGGNGGTASSEETQDNIGNRENYNRPFSRESRPHGDRKPYGRRGGRDRGGRGRQGGRGGRDRGPGGFGRHGRELPQSKYASHRPYEPPEAGSAEAFEPVLLPGESISSAKHPEPGPFAAGEPSAAAPFEGSVAPAEHSVEERSSVPEERSAEIESSDAGAPSGAEFETSSQLPGEQISGPSHSARSEERSQENDRHDRAPASYQPRFSRDSHGRDRDRGRGGRFGRGRGDDRRGHYRREHGSPETPSGWITSLEPLPGESLSKAKAHEPATPEPAFGPAHEALTHPSTHPHDEAIAGDEHFPEETSLAPPETADVEEQAGEQIENQPSMDASVEPHHSPELTEEEATALAEHVAEAQQEEAEREAAERAEAAAESLAYSADVEGYSADVETQEEAQEAAAASELEESSDEDDDEESEEAEASGGEASLIAEEADEATEVTREEAEAAAEEIEASEANSQDQLAAAAAAGETSSVPTEARMHSDFRPRMQRPMRRGGRDRGRGGRRPFHKRPHHRGQPRRNQLISELLKAGQEIIVQIAKEPLGKKGARITSHIALPGRFLVYMPTLDHTGVSRKIASAEERSRLRHLVNDAKGSAGGGFIVRTAAASASPDEVRADVEFLTKTWSEIKSNSEQRKAPSLLHRDLNLVERILRDYLSSDYTSIWVDTEEEYTKILDFVSRFQPALANRVKLFTKSTPIFEEFGIQQEIDKGLRPKVWLKSGGYIVINHTEALVAIDVNTGKFVGRGSNRLEDTIVRTNIEAVKEIVRQIRLRDLGGIIIIDFIDMEERRNRDKVMAALEDALKADRAPSKVLRFNEFGLVAITRKRTKQALERTLCQPCPYCTGSGMVKSIPTLCYEIQSEARKMAPEIDAASLTLRVHPEIAKALKTRESSLMDELEKVTKKSLIIQADPTLHWEQYDIY